MIMEDDLLSPLALRRFPSWSLATRGKRPCRLLRRYGFALHLDFGYTVPGSLDVTDR